MRDIQKRRRRPAGGHRRGADSAGNAKVFEDFDALVRPYDRPPEEFAATDVGRIGTTGSRRHVVVRHFGERPAFDRRISRRSPLTVEKETPESVDSGAAIDSAAD